MSNKLKTAVSKMKINGVLEKFHAITSFEAVGKEFNEDGTVKVSLADELTALATALAEKANSANVSNEIQTACQTLYNKIVGKANADTTIDEAYDTLKEIADWIGTHGDAAAVLTNDIIALKTSVESLTKQIENFKNTTVEKSETNGNVKVDGKEIEVYKNPGKNVFVASTEEEVTAAEQKMQEGDLLFQIVSE